MAVMYPRTLLGDDLKSRAEGKVFRALEAGLDDEWKVLHSVGWVSRDKERGSDDGEIDFVIAHPERGVLCLEVKGGGIECRNGEWFGIHDGEQERIRDPFAQAVDHTHDLRRELGGMPAKGGGELLIGHALAFPDVTVHELVLAPDAPPALIVDRNGIKDIATALERAYAYHRPAGGAAVGPGANGIRKLLGALAPNVRIEVPMAERFLDEEEALVTLTHDQALLLQRYGRDKRMIVTGPAGSGKTMLAVERAKRVAAKGDDVLFVCFNRRLRDHLRRAEKGSGIDFYTFHGICTRLAGIAGVPLSTDGGGEPGPRYFGEELPLALVAAIEELGPRYDALFVDEAQDLSNDWLDALMTTLRDPDDALVWLFMDDNQRIYHNRLEVPAGFRPFDLIHNCRNTQAIHRLVMEKYEGEVEVEAIGPEGREVELIHADDQPGAVRATVARLCGSEEIPPQDVVVLSSHGIGKSAVAAAGCGRYEFVDEPRPLGDFIRFASIRAFKGLESRVVILCELEDLDDETIDQQLYVGLSRARNHCVIAAPTRA